MARRHARVFTRPAPRTKMWIGNGLGRTVIVGGAKTFIAQLGTLALSVRPFTILRTRLVIGWTSDQEAADEGPFGEYGQTIVTENASGVGVTALPDPSSVSGDPENDWFVHQPVVAQLAIIGAISAATLMSQIMTVDSKAMRKVGIDDQVVDMFTEDGGVGGLLWVMGRQLIQLH